MRLKDQCPFQPTTKTSVETEIWIGTLRDSKTPFPVQYPLQGIILVCLPASIPLKPLYKQICTLINLASQELDFFRLIAQTMTLISPEIWYSQVRPCEVGGGGSFTLSLKFRGWLFPIPTPRLSSFVLFLHLQYFNLPLIPVVFSQLSLIRKTTTC